MPDDIVLNRAKALEACEMFLQGINSDFGRRPSQLNTEILMSNSGCSTLWKTDTGAYCPKKDQPQD